MLFCKEYEIKYYEQNVKGYLKESALFNFLQDIATLSAESLGFGPSFVFSKNYAWVVLKYHIEIYSEIRNFSSIEIRTESRGTTKLFAFRDFELYSPNKELVGKVVSAWALIDMSSRKMLPMQKVLDFVQHFEKRENDLEYSVIEPVLTSEYQKDFEIRFDDIDVNHHANNSNYIVWALETLPDEFRMMYNPKVIDIKYSKEIGTGGEITAKTQKFSSGSTVKTLHLIKNKKTNEELASINIIWK